MLLKQVGRIPIRFRTSTVIRGLMNEAQFQRYLKEN